MWIRVAVGMKNDPRIGHVAAAIGKDVGATLGYVTSLLCELPDHARTGDLSAIPDTTLEQWALWRGRPGMFARAFLEHLCEGRVVRAWMKHNGAPLRDLDQKRAAMAARRAAEKAARVAADRPTITIRGGNGGGNSGGNVPPNVGDVCGPYGTVRNELQEHPPTPRAADAAVRVPKGDDRPEPEGFPEAWAAYPRRAGGNPRRAAAAAYRARLAEGTAPGELVAGARRYAAYVEATGAAGSQYVKQAATFFGPEGHFRESWDAPTVAARPLTRQEREDAEAEARAAAEQARYEETVVWLQSRGGPARNGAHPTETAGVPL